MNSVVQSKALAIGEALVLANVITRHQLDIAIAQQKVMLDRGESVRIGVIIQRLGFCSKDAIESVQEKNRVGNRNKAFNLKVKYLADDICKEYIVAPNEVRDGVFSIFTAVTLTDDQKGFLLREAQQADASIETIETIAVGIEHIRDTLSMYSDMGSQQIPELCEKLRINADDTASLTQLRDAILLDAMRLNASDIHMEKTASSEFNWLSYRIDGSLRRYYLLPEQVMAAIFMRIKTESQMDASESRRPQDGRFDFNTGSKRVDVRVSDQPMVAGEKLVMRLLDPDSLKTLDELFVHFPELSKRFTQIAKASGKTGGIVLITGATGQGKTTTMYAVLQAIPRDRVNVITVENPVEFRLPLTVQIQLNDFLEQKYLDVLRGLLRQDPDFLVLGETRDADSASAALRFVESGHMVMTTLHTNDIPKSFARLLNMVPDPKEAAFVLGGYTKAVLNQRLVRKLCSCSEMVDSIYLKENKSKFAELGLHEHDNVLLLRRPVGCKYCSKTGYRGRLIIPEAWFVTNPDRAQQQITEILSGPTNDFHLVTKVDGTEYHSRADALKVVLLKGLTDVNAALEVLGVS